MYWEAPIADVDIDVDTHSTMSTVTELPAELKAEAESEASIDQVEQNVIDTGLSQEVGAYLVSISYPCQPLIIHRHSLRSSRYFLPHPHRRGQCLQSNISASTRPRPTS